MKYSSHKPSEKGYLRATLRKFYTFFFIAGVLLPQRSLAQSIDSILSTDTQIYNIVIGDYGVRNSKFQSSQSSNTFKYTYAALKKPQPNKLAFALKTNLLYDAAITPNIGIEFALPHNWSIGGSWTYAWWSNQQRGQFWRIYGGEIDVRKYFPRNNSDRPLSGHHVGIYFQAGTYDFAFGHNGQLSPFTVGAGFEYGYSLPITKQLNLDFGIGVGVLWGNYKQYTHQDDCYVWQGTKQRTYFGPTRLEISLVWLIFK